MKKLMIISVLVLSAFAVKAAGENISYVTIDGKTHFCQVLKTGLFRTTLIKDGLVMKVPFRKVDAYMKDGHLYERLPVICEDGRVRGTALMEYITQRNGLRLYKLCRYTETCDPEKHVFGKAEAEYTYFVFRDGKFYLRVDEKNALTALPFFGVKVIA
jgi:hypothetical protein